MVSHLTILACTLVMSPTLRASFRSPLNSLYKVELYYSKKNFVQKILTLTLFTERFPHKPFVEEMSNVTVYIGERLQLHCRAFSDATSFIEWSRPLKINGSYTDENGIPYSETIPVGSHLIVPYFFI